jgi:hypothetical protein
MTEKITTNNLYQTKYTMDVLEKNVDRLNKKVLLCTQTLTAEFCVKHILEMDIDSGSEDSYIFDKNYILERQEHITEEEFYTAYKLFCGKS